MKTTIKNVVDFYKTTKSEHNFSVISFNPETKRREQAYGGFDLMHAISALSTEGAKGLLVILTNKRGWDFIFNYEETNHKRVTFEDMKPYRMHVDEFSHEYKSAAFIL